jgi:hypothetical protein
MMQRCKYFESRCRFRCKMQFIFASFIIKFDKKSCLTPIFANLKKENMVIKFFLFNKNYSATSLSNKLKLALNIERISSSSALILPALCLLITPHKLKNRSTKALLDGVLSKINAS